MQQNWLTPLSDGFRITVQIQPNAKKTEVIGIHDFALKVKVHAQPIEGKANEALIRFLADSLHIPKSSISLIHGLTSKKKILDLKSAKLTQENICQLLLLV